MKSQTKAELKPPKFGETLPSNVEGNPEPSLLLEEGVETRRAVCKRCNKELTGQQRYFCSARCRSYYHYLQKGKFKKPGVGSGNNQWGENNHQYKTGI
jgi:hypothetical protein